MDMERVKCVRVKHSHLNWNWNSPRPSRKENNQNYIGKYVNVEENVKKTSVVKCAADDERRTVNDEQ